MKNNTTTPNRSKSDASPATGSFRYICLTNNRSFQQNVEKIKESKKRLKGKKFRIRINKPAFCRSRAIALIETNENKVNKIKYTGIPCNFWTCPDCCIKKALQVKYLLRDVIKLNNLNCFLTLTLDPKKIPTDYIDDTHKYITKIFNHFITILKRHKVNKSNLELKYVWVIEFQKNGNAHMHILFNKFLPIKVIRSLWLHVGGGVQMKAEQADSLIGISNYISDYIVKGIKGEFEDKPYGFRYNQKRYSISRSCIRPNKRSYLKITIKEQLTSFPKLYLSQVYNTLNNLGDEDIIVEL